MIGGLYGITGQEARGQIFEIYTRHTSTSAASASLTLNFPDIPRDKILYLRNIQCETIPGATQSAINVTVRATTHAGLNFNVAVETFPADADERQTLNWQGDVLLLGPVIASINSVTVIATFSAGVASNFVSGSLQGLVVPRGNAAAF